MHVGRLAVRGIDEGIKLLDFLLRKSVYMELRQIENFLLPGAKDCHV